MSIDIPISVPDHAPSVAAQCSSSVCGSAQQAGLKASFARRERSTASGQQDLLFFPGPELKSHDRYPLGCARGIVWALVLQAAALAAFVIITFLL
jgi:hypothetical protein